MLDSLFSFNQFSSLLLVGVVPSVLHLVLLLVRGWREERWNDLFAAGILLVGIAYVSQWMLGFAGWYDARDGRTTIMFYVLWDHLLLLGPLVYLYFRAVTNTNFRFGCRQLCSSSQFSDLGR